MIAANTKILVVITERVGDALFYTTSIALLRHHLPLAQIDVVALSAAAADIYRHNPYINQLLVRPDEKDMPELAKQYDHILVMHRVLDSLKYGNLCGEKAYFCIGHEREHHSLVPRHFIESFLGIHDNAFPQQYYLFPQSEDKNKVRKLLANKGLLQNNDEILIAFHMGCYKIAERSKKFWKRNITSHRSWPFDRFKQLADRLLEHDPRIRILITGTASEGRLAQKIFKKKAEHIAFITGETSVLELACLMNHLRVFVTGDTGPLHIAATTTVPIVALFGPTTPAIAGPLPPRPQHTLLSKGKITDISVDEVFQAVCQCVNPKNS